MNGWAKFFLLIVCCVFTLILWPFYDWTGLKFMGMLFLLWTALILLVSILTNLLALYKVEILNRFISLVFVLAMMASLVYYFPLENKQTPYLRLQNNVWPTLSDIKAGIKRLTFNFDFVRRNVHRDANYVNQKLDKNVPTKEEVKKTVQKTQDVLDILVEPIEEEEEQPS